MPEYDDTDDSFNTRVRESFNTSNTSNTSNLAVDLDNVGNTDGSVNDSGNTWTTETGVGNADNSVNDSGNSWTDITDSGNVDSHDSSLGVDGSYNDNSDNSDNSDNTWTDNSDNSTNGSYNDASSWAEIGSGNSYLDESSDDHSVNVGIREYNTGFGDVSLGGAGGGGGDVWINNQNTIVDQSVNGNFDGLGEGVGGAGNSAVVASGDGAYAAGGDINLSQSVDRSTNFDAQGDINLNNTTEVTNITGSYNDESIDTTWTDNSVDTSIDGSFNDESESYTADNSYNDVLVSDTESTWNIDSDVIWGSHDAAIVEDTTVDADFDGS